MHNDASTKIKHATIGVSILSGSESGSYTVGYSQFIISVIPIKIISINDTKPDITGVSIYNETITITINTQQTVTTNILCNLFYL